MPPADSRWLGSLLMALVAHALLVAALTWGIGWQKQTTTAVAQAELWARMPQSAAPRLVDEGRLDWADPVVSHLPEFALSDPDVTRAHGVLVDAQELAAVGEPRLERLLGQLLDQLLDGTVLGDVDAIEGLAVDAGGA